MDFDQFCLFLSLLVSDDYFESFLLPQLLREQKRIGLCVSVFQGSLLVILIMIGGNEKRHCGGGF